MLDPLFAAEQQLPERAARNRRRPRPPSAIFLGRGGAGDTSGQAPGSRWCALNAIAGWADFERRYTRRSNQVQRSFEDTQLKQHGLELAVAA